MDAMMDGHYTLTFRQYPSMFSNGRKQRRKEVRFEIIPMIDVMMILVLFLAVMAFLPSVQSAIQTNLPGSGSEDPVSMEDIMLTINSSGTIFVNERSVTNVSLVPEVQKALKGNLKRRVVLAADKELAYEYVIQMLSALRKAGIKNVALATEPEQSSGSK
jgi:biopolymer transport protein ExbD